MTCPAFGRFSCIELGPKPGESSAAPRERYAKRCPTPTGFERSRGLANTRANTCARHCILAISCPEPGAGAAASAPLSGAADTPEAQPSRRVLSLGIENCRR